MEGSLTILSEKEARSDKKALFAVIFLFTLMIAGVVVLGLTPRSEASQVMMAGSAFFYGYILGFPSLWRREIKPERIRLSIGILFSFFAPIFIYILIHSISFRTNGEALMTISQTMLLSGISVANSIAGFSVATLIRAWFDR